MSNPDKRAHWQEHIDAWQRSGLSQKAYCQSQGLALGTFGYWRKRLAGAGSRTTGSQFLAVGSASAPAVVRAHLPGGIVLEVPASSLAGVLPVVCQSVQGGGDA